MSPRHRWTAAELLVWAERAEEYVAAGAEYDGTPEDRERYRAAQVAWGGGYDHAAMLADALPALRHWVSIGR